MKKAYDNWNLVIEYDGKSLLNFKQNRRSSARNELQMGAIDYPGALDHQLQLPHLPVAVPTEQVQSGPQVGGKHYDSFKCLALKEFSFKLYGILLDLFRVVLIKIILLITFELPFSLVQDRRLTCCE